MENGGESEYYFETGADAFYEERYQNQGSWRDGYKIPHRELVAASVEVFDEDSGIYYEPKITDITERMEGDLVLYNCCLRSVALLKRCFGMRQERVCCGIPHSDTLSGAFYMAGVAK